MHPLPENATINSVAPSRRAPTASCSRPPTTTGRSSFVRADGGGFKVIRPENGNDTVSEGIAYGMLIAVYMTTSRCSTACTATGRRHVATTALMTWCIPAGGGSCSASGGTATDADEDAAFAMLMASKQWPSGSYARRPRR